MFVGGDWQTQGLAVALHGHCGLFPGMADKGRGELGERGSGCRVNGYDVVAFFQSGLSGGLAGYDAVYM